MLGATCLERFLKKVNKTDSCWFWTGYRTNNGYGRFRDGQTVIGAHRMAWMLTNGQIPPDKELDHLCRNRACVNPSHLEVVDHLTNIRRSPHVNKTHCLNGHPFSGNNLYFNGHKRFCRQCFRDRAKARCRLVREKHESATNGQ